MTAQEFETLLSSGLLRMVERVVVDAHRRSYEAKGLEWTEPLAYQWLRFEDPDPVSRLLEGVRRLRRRGVRFDTVAVDKAIQAARKAGISN